MIHATTGRSEQGNGQLQHTGVEVFRTAASSGHRHCHEKGRKTETQKEKTVMEKRWLVIEEKESGKVVAERQLPEGFIGDRNFEQTMGQFKFEMHGRVARSRDGKHRYYFRTETRWRNE